MTSDRPRCIPQFLGIGVVRGGTTWLWKQLGQHPDVWLTPVKELNYFTRRHPIMVARPDDPAPRAEHQPSLFVQSLRRFTPAKIAHYLRTYSPRSALWRWKFYRGDLGPQWYRSLFDPADGRLSGDITPHYSALSEDGVREIVDTLPGVKILLILRDPIARDWSHAVHYLTYNLKRERASLTVEDILAHVHDPSARSRGDYLPMLDLWRRHIPADRFKVLFFDDVHTRPVELLHEVQAFLGLAAHTPPGLTAQVNASGAAPIPDEVERHLSELHLPALETLALELGGPAVTWRNRAREVLSRARPES
jgi:hypothetical protein